MKSTPEPLQIDVGDIVLGAVRWRGSAGSPVVFAIHGMTANAWSWSSVADALDGDLSLVAIDLRWRGMSNAVTEPYGIRQHADDLAAIIDRMSAAPAMLVGHSLGASVALATAERHPHTVSQLVLVDGGPYTQMPPNLTVPDALRTIIGSAAERIGRVWSDRVSYRRMWSEHPAFAGGLSPDLERYLLSDLVACAGGLECNVNVDAVRADGTDLLTDTELCSLFERRIDPVFVVRAENGGNNQPPPFIRDELVERHPQHHWKTVVGANHYTILFGADGAAAVADTLRAAVNSRP
jgi:pimeloyl-ACP methyl ester carboxylesterase